MSALSGRPWARLGLSAYSPSALCEGRGAERGSLRTSIRQQGEHCSELQERLVLWMGLEQGFCCSRLSYYVWLLYCSPPPKALAMSRQFVVCVAETEPHLPRAARVTPFWQALSLQSVGVWHKRPR